MARKFPSCDLFLTILPDSAQRFLMRWAIAVVRAMRRGWLGFPMQRALTPGAKDR